jgi:hypothetical protein
MVRYKMLARDIYSVPLQYRTWVVPDEPDFTAQYYTGPISGPISGLVDISAYAILDDSVIADFDLPLPTLWQSLPDTPFDFFGRLVMPAAISDSQLAVIDGYIYLFGGKVTSHIYQASTDNPGNWIDTGATLPTALYGSSLAIVGAHIYLFGGNDGYGSVNTIFSAPVNNPLDWTQVGTMAPGAVESSSLAMANGHLYLFGGLQGDIATSQILTASTSTPTTWSVAGGSGLDAIYGSTILQANGYWYLLGGQLNALTTTTNIYQATVATPTVWSTIGHLPYPSSFGQIFTFGGTDGYYIGPSPGDAGTTFTTIIHCYLNNLTQWQDTRQVIPACISHSHNAIIYDRFWFFGGSGLSAVFANDQMLKYDFNNATVLNYANITRTVLQSTDNLDNPFLALGLPYWKTDYQL